MKPVKRSAKFYAVGGPVQPDRPCYVKRDADDLLLKRLLDGEYCHVLAQRNTGKTSLAAHTAWNLRDRDVRVAVIDFTQLLRNEQGDTSGRWYYSIAYRIVRDLRIKSDMQAWWADHSGLTNQQRLVEFFFEVVLAENDRSYVVFVDRLDVMAGHPLAQEFLAAVRSCYDMRSTEPEFQRLTFCLLGAGTPEELVKSVQDSPFGISFPVPLGDFRRGEIDCLLEGLGSEGVLAEQVVSRIWWWTRGHPYLTQKLFRGLARRQDEVLSGDTVDELVASLFLGPAETEETNLAAVAESVLQQNSTRVARLSLYGKICKGGEVTIDKSSRPQRELLAAGIVVENNAGMLAIRNNIYAEVFSTRWVNQNLPFGWRKLGIAAAVAALVVLMPVWYTEYLPRPYERALSAATQDYQVAYEAYESLRFYPGYTDRADRLFSEFLARQSRAATGLPDALRTYQRMLTVPGSEMQAEETLAEFWDRHSASLALAGDRDAALLAQLNALTVPTESRRRNAAAFIGADYRQLVGTIRSGNRLKGVRVDSQTGQLAVLDDQHLVQVWQLNEGQVPALLGDFELAAEERLQMQSSLVVSAPPQVASMKLIVRTDHPRVRDVQVVLRAPSGGTATLNLSDAAIADAQEYVFDAARFPALKNLLADDASGTWNASFADTERGVTGLLLDWTISIPDAIAEPGDNMTPAAQIPEPVLTTLIQSVLGPDGRTALVWPDDENISGDLLVWDLPSGRVLSRVPRSADFIDATYVLNGAGVMTLTQKAIGIYETATGTNLGDIALPLAGGAPQAMSQNGRFIVLAIERDDGSRGYQTWDLTTRQAVGAVISAEGAGTVAVDSQGRYLAISDKDRLVRIWSLRDATLFREFRQSSRAAHLAFDLTGAWLVSQDVRHTLRVWSVEGSAGFPVLERSGNEFWQYVFGPTGERLFVGSGGRSYDLISLPSGRSIGQSLRQPTVIADADYERVPPPLLLSTRNLAITSDGQSAVKLWQLAAQQTLADAAAPVPVSRSALSSAGDRIALGTADGGVRVVALDNDPGLLISLSRDSFESSHGADVSVLRFDASGGLLASGAVNGTIKIWDSTAGVPLQFEARHQDGAIVDLAFSPAGDVLISASPSLLVVTDVLSGERLAEQRITGRVPQLSVVGSDSAVLVAGTQNGVVLWNWQAGTVEQLVSPEYQVRHAVTAADDKLLVTAGEDNRLILWDVATREIVGESATLPGSSDSLWGFSEPAEVLVRSGHWLQRYELQPVGLLPKTSVLLPEATAVIQPDTSAETVRVLARVGSSRPVVSEVSLTMPKDAPVDGEVEQLLQEWRSKLSLSSTESAQPGTL